MRFQTEHHFSGSRLAVEAILSDAAFYLDLVLPDLSQPQVIESQVEGDDSLLRLRYEYLGSLDPIAHRMLGSSRLVWIQEMRIDRAAGSGTLHFEIEKDPRRLHGTAGFTLTETKAGTVRNLDGELVVAIPGVGRMAERRIVPGLLTRLDVEARAVNDRLCAEA